MPISMHCSCDRAFKVKDELAGKKIRCPACKKVLTVPEPEIVITVEEDAAEFLIAEEPAPKVRKPARRRDEEDEDEADERVTAKPTPRMKPAPRRNYDDDDDDDEIRPRRGRKRRRERESSGFPSIAISPAITGGVLMMLIAVVWFTVALYFGWIFYYPPIMFCLGIASVWRGVTGQE